MICLIFEVNDYDGSCDICSALVLCSRREFASLREVLSYLKMNDLHDTFGGAHFDFEITDSEARMIESVISLRLCHEVKYQDLYVRQKSGRKYTVEVNATGQVINFVLMFLEP